MADTFRVVERSGWFYVLDEDGCEFEYSGPWRYRHDAQDYADELNAPPSRPALRSFPNDGKTTDE